MLSASTDLLAARRKQDSLAEWSKALAPGASPKGRGFEPHSCHSSSTGSSILLCAWLALMHLNVFFFMQSMRHTNSRTLCNHVGQGAPDALGTHTPPRQECESTPTRAPYCAPGRPDCGATPLFCWLREWHKTAWPSGLRRWLQAPVRKGVGSNPTTVTLKAFTGHCLHQRRGPAQGKAHVRSLCFSSEAFKTVWPSGLRRWLQAPVRKGVGSNPTAVTL